MGASAGRYGVNIGTGAASGAGIGATFGPIGAGIGAGVGALAGGLSTLLQSSDEAKQKKKALDDYEKQRAAALEAYKRQQLESSQKEWEQRYAALTGLSNDPMYIAQSYDPYDPQKAEADFNARAPDESQQLGERFDASVPQPNYGGLVQSLGGLGSTVGTLSRQSDAADRLGLAQIGSSKNPWTAYDDPNGDEALQDLLKQARENAWSRTGGW